MRVRTSFVVVLWVGGGWLANFAWEVGQATLYAGHTASPSHLSDCLGAACVDALVLAGLYARLGGHDARTVMTGGW